MKPPSFSCDSCQAPVGLHDKRCPSCGRIFDAVRCPRCGHQGRPEAFLSGCPSCRYLAPRAPVPPQPKAPRRLFGPVMAVLAVLLGASVVISWLLRRG